MTDQNNDTIVPEDLPQKPAEKPSLGLKAADAPGKSADHVCQCGCGKK